MPAIYAHERFGAKVLDRMDGELKDIIEKYHTQFRIGLQGPDIFFFYRAWSGNKVTQYGDHLHELSVKNFLLHAKKVVQKKGRDSAEYAYILGLICHFALDSECHPFVEMMIEETGVQHLEIEEEFEKLLLREDGLNALSYPVSKLIPTDRETAEAIAPFYAKSVDAKLVRSSLRYMRFIKKLFTAPDPVRQGIINFAMKKIGCYEERKGLMNQRVDNPDCAGSNAGLMVLFDQAIDLAVRLLYSYDETVRGEHPLEERFDRNYV